ncbi:MAG: zinc ribbon domain-containing protein [Nitrososphaerota archaeon]
MYSYKIVKGELIFNNAADAKKIDELINEWHSVVIQYANMYAKIERFIEIPTRLPENLKKTAKEYAEQLVKQNGKHCIFADSKKAKEIKEDIEKKIKNAENIVSKKAIKHLKKKKIIAINNNFIKLERNYVRSNDGFKTVILTTLEKYKTINAWFRCKRKQLLIEALNSPKRTKHFKAIEVCDPLIKKEDNRYFLIFPIRKLVKLSTIEELSNELDEGFNILSIDINLDDVCYAIYKVNTNNYKRIFIDRIKWNIAEWIRVKQIDAYAKERYKTLAKRLWKKLKLKNLGICQRISNEIVKNALKYNVKAIIYEDLNNEFKNKSKDFNYKIRRWFYRKILNYLINSANWNGIATIYVDPENTSKICPKCNNELKEYDGFHYLECKNCGYKDDRDHIAVANITKKFLKLLLNSKSLEGEGLRTQPKTLLQAR